MDLKDIYYEIGKQFVIILTLYIPAMLIEGNYNVVDWSIWTRLLFALLFTYINILAYDVDINSKVKKTVKETYRKSRSEFIRNFNRLRQWH